METKNIPGAPEAIGPYCHAVRTGNLIFCSGQTPLDPETMQIVPGGIAEQTERALKNIEIVLGGMGLSLQNVVKSTVYLRDMDDFPGMNVMYERIFSPHRPARTTISVRRNPLDALVEIECIAEIQAVEGFFGERHP